MPALTLIATALVAWVYLRGSRTLGQRASRGSRELAFLAGIAAVCGALLSPLDALAHESFALHMIQHEILMIAAAPLLVLGEPLALLLLGLPERARDLTLRAARACRLARIARASTGPGTAAAIFAAVLWLWHAPALFDAASVGESGLHELQHLSFFVAALIFWSAMLRARGDRAGVAALALLATTVHCGVLGALITFAPQRWYAGGDAHAWGLSALEDQQLGGLVMWVPGSVPFVIAGVAMLARWIASSSRRARVAEESIARASRASL